MMKTQKTYLKMMNRFNFKDFEREDFLKHIRNSIPGYHSMRAILPSIASNFLPKGTNVYDLGCSGGDLLHGLKTSFRLSDQENISYVGYDLASNLFPKKPDEGIDLYERDVTEESLKLFNTSLVFSLFTLQFIQLPKRKKLIQKVYDSLDKRGAFIVCEKITSSNGFIEDIFTFTNYDLKDINKLSPHDILQKQKDLRGIMFPLSQKENEEMFREAGFEVVEVFYKSLNFIGWILVK